MFTILINLVVTENSLQQQERVKVFVMPARGVIEDTNTWVDHLVISYHEETWVEYSLFCAYDRQRVFACKAREVLFTQINKLLMFYFASTYYDNILSVIVSPVEIYNHVPINRSNIVNISKNRLSHHVFSVNIVVDIFH